MVVRAFTGERYSQVITCSLQLALISPTLPDPRLPCVL
jgi:hypothetical protein